MAMGVASHPMADSSSFRMRTWLSASSKRKRAERWLASKVPIFARDGSPSARMARAFVVSTNDGPAVHVWDLRGIRKQLAVMGLDWDAPAFPDEPGFQSVPALHTLSVDFGKLAERLEGFNEPPEKRIQANTARLKQNPEDADAYHMRGHALLEVNRPSEGIDDFSRAIRLRPDDTHLLAMCGGVHAAIRQYDLAIADMEAASRAGRTSPSFARGWLGPVTTLPGTWRIVPSRSAI